MIEDFVSIWELSSFQMTLTGSYWRDQQEFPGFWKDVYTYLSVYGLQEHEVVQTVESLRNSSDRTNR